MTTDMNTEEVIPEAERLAKEGDAYQVQGETQRAISAYKRALRIDPRYLYAHNRIEEIGGAESFQFWMGFDCQIDPQDEIFKFFAAHPTSINPIRDYLADGWRTMMELLYILEDLGRPLKGCDRFLEFACGYGRFTRHLSVPLKDKELVVSDVMPGSVDFLRKHFEVQGFYSDARPDAVNIPKKFNIIFVLSLFTHLPEINWGPWLSKLFSALEEGGLLIFSTHGKKFAQIQGVTFPSSGFFYTQDSESEFLSGDEYGTTYTTPEYVRKTVLEETGQPILRQYTSYFWKGQDAFVVMKPERSMTKWRRRFRRCVGEP
jgi:SAM-dependent methyltransferase